MGICECRQTFTENLMDLGKLETRYQVPQDHIARLSEK